MVSVVARHPPNCGLIVHTRMDESPMLNAVTPEVAKDGVVTIAVPAITDHAPLSPTPTAFAANVAVVMLHKF